MLYLSTRNKTDSFTAFRALTEDHTPDGGLFVPFHLPVFGQQELAAFAGGSFSENAAQILNLFFTTGLTGWDVESCAGRRLVKMHSMTHRIRVAEVWHNLDGVYSAWERSVYRKLSGADREPSGWAKIAIGIAVLFGIYPELSLQGGETFDIAVAAGDFTAPMAAWYARRMGLPIGTVICGCNDNSCVWDFIHLGEFPTGGAVRRTELPELDVSAAAGIEGLVYAVYGTEEACRYRDISLKKGTYQPPEQEGIHYNHGLYAAVVSSRRVRDTVNSIWRTNAYMIDPYTALTCAALQDYRARTGESRLTLVLAERSPVRFREMIAEITGAWPDTGKDPAEKG